MAPDLLTRCPACAAAVRPGTPWCGQCFTDLTPKPAPVVAPPAPQAPTGSTWPCATCGARNPLDAPACASCGAGFLAALRTDAAPLLVLPVVGDLGALSRGQRLGLAAAVVVAVVLLTLLVGLLLS